MAKATGSGAQSAALGGLKSQINNQNSQTTGIENSQLLPTLSTAQDTAASILPGVTSGYADISTTGGYSPGQISSMEDSASEAAQSAYQTGASASERASAATGGYGVSGSITGSLARQASNAASQAAQGVEGSIAQSQVSNKLAALGGSSNIYGMNEQQVTQTINQILQNYQQSGQLNNQDLSIITNLASQPGPYQQILQGLKTLGQAGAGAMSAT